MRDYRDTLLEAARVLCIDGDINMRLSLVACLLIQIDDSDVPPGALGAFDRVRAPLIASPLIVRGKMMPRDFDDAKALQLTRAFSDLLLTELEST